MTSERSWVGREEVASVQPVVHWTVMQIWKNERQNQTRIAAVDYRGRHYSTLSSAETETLVERAGVVSSGARLHFTNFCAMDGV